MTHEFTVAHLRNIAPLKQRYDTAVLCVDVVVEAVATFTSL